MVTPQKNCLPGNLVECYYNQGVMPSGDYEISPKEYFQLLLAISLDVDKQKPEDLKNYESIRKMYDTPFYDFKTLNGEICVKGMFCRNRQELNYIAQGMWSASVNEGKIALISAIILWKKESYNKLPSSDTITSAIEGYDFYMLIHPKKLISSILGGQIHITGAQALYDAK